MKYLMLICADESVVLSPAEVTGLPAATQAWVTEMDGSGVRLTGDRLRPVSDATTVRVRDTEVLVADGPFAETKEQIAGFDIIECADLDQAIDVAAKHPVARFGTIDVRPFWQQ
jgi:hypothetical protein